MPPFEDSPGARTWTLRSGDGQVDVDLARYARVKAVEPAAHPACDPDRLLDRALAAPLASASLKHLASGARRVVVSIPDATRPAVARRLLPRVLKEIESAEGPHEITVFLAAGAHACVSDEAARRVAGGSIPPGIPVRQNDARKPSDFILARTTRRGTPIVINRLVLEADLNVIIGTATFHYFAGMGGGRKMVVPGACNLETASANHRLSLADDGDLHPRCRSGVLEGNPVHEDMVEGMLCLPRVFLINVVPDAWGGIAGLTCGHGVDSHLEACSQARALLEVPIGRRCDLAVASAGGHPWDVDLIQTHKAIDHAAAAVRDGGVVIALAECARGVGSDTFLPWFELGDAQAISAGLRSDYRLNGQTALSLARKLERIRIVLVSSLGPEVVCPTGMICARGLDEALVLAEEYVGGDPLTYVLPNASGILPTAEVQV